MNKKIESALKILIVASLIVLILLFFGVVVLESYLLKGEKEEVEEVEVLEKEEEEIIEILYNEREKILETVEFERDDNRGIDIYDFYKVGTITSGKYKEGDLILVSKFSSGPGKGPTPGPIYLRYIKKDDVVIFLPKISNLLYGDYFSKINPFKKFDFKLEIDNNFTISIFEYPEEIKGENERQILKNWRYLSEEYGKLDLSILYRVFTHSKYGDIYTTKEGFGPSKSFEKKEEGGWFGTGAGIEGCRNEDCFFTNQFFIFRPDGTFLKFNYEPDISIENIAWEDNKEIGNRYVFYTIAGCSRQALDYGSIVNSLLLDEDDLIIIGKTNDTGDLIYELKDKNHKIYTEFYYNYKEYYIDSSNPIYPEEKRKIKSFDEFINSHPVFFWKDPFNRIIRFNNDEFLPPAMCEPIIYLYPEKEQEISIFLDEIINISDSIPEYRDGWNVIAGPLGNILNLKDDKNYPYLFWEGWSFIFPIQEKGFVVRKEEVSDFLIKTLPKLGLNKKEKEDFLEFWLPYFSEYPYYFITFIDQDIIDKVAPITISPKPNTIIRILMDVKALNYPINVKELEFKEVPERIGFTVVEWGGLKR